VTSDPTDEELLARHLGGDRDAFTLLVGRHERRVYGICLRMLGGVEDAQDATQETFLAVLRRAGTFRGGSAFSTWLYRVAVNCAIDQSRKRGRLRTSPLEPEEASRPHPGEDPGEQVATSLTVQTALAGLPEEFRAAVVLCDLCRLPYAEAAEVLEVAVGTVKSRVFRGRLALAKELHGLDPRPGQPEPDESASPGTAAPAPPSEPMTTQPLSQINAQQINHPRINHPRIKE
jgi:RNA polymerase sigma-70 factor, ECF subfamily